MFALTEQHKQAAGDFSACLALQTAAGLDLATDRRIAESHYQLGLAHSGANQWSEAVASYRTATAIITARIASLEKDVAEAKGKNEEEEGLVAMAKELRELRSLLPEILIKVPHLIFVSFAYLLID